MEFKTMKLITVQDAALILQYSPNMVYELFELGELKGYQRKKKGKILIYEASVYDFIEKNSNEIKG